VQPKRCQPLLSNISGIPFILITLFPFRFADYLAYLRTMVTSTAERPLGNLLHAGSHKSCARRAKKFLFAFFA